MNQIVFKKQDCGGIKSQLFMEKIIKDFSIGLFLWQVLLFVVIIVVIYFMVKLYKKIILYLDNKTRASK